jgi:hypothetical protein
MARFKIFVWVIISVREGKNVCVCVGGGRPKIFSNLSNIHVKLLHISVNFKYYIENVYVLFLKLFPPIFARIMFIICPDFIFDQGQLPLPCPRPVRLFGL